jgi:hypothetical protein
METYKREVITASQQFDENYKLSEILAAFAQGLFEEGLIKISTGYDKETGKLYKELSVKLIKEERS